MINRNAPGIDSAVSRRFVWICITLTLFLFPGKCLSETKRADKDREVLMNARSAETVEEAYRLLKPLADRNNFKAMHRIGEMMVTRPNSSIYNLYEGFRLFVTAAKAGEARAQWELAVQLSKDRYLNSSNMTMRREALRWYYAAAEQGYALAQQSVGQMLADGFDDRRDYVEAYMWLTLALRRYTGTTQKRKIHNDFEGFAANEAKALVEDGYLNEKEVQVAIKKADQWEKDHPNAYKVWPIAELEY